MDGSPVRHDACRGRCVAFPVDADTLWEIVEPLLPGFRVRPQCGGQAALDDQAVFTAIVYVLPSGCAWGHLPPSFGSASRPPIGVSQPGPGGVFDQLRRQVLDRLGAGGGLDWSTAILDAAHVRAKKGSLTGPSPVDRGKNGSKVHILSDADGIPPMTAVNWANTYDSVMLQPTVTAIGGGALASRATPPTRSAAGGQGLRRPRAPPVAARTGHRPADRSARRRQQRAPGPVSMEDRTYPGLADRLPTTDKPLRTPR